MPTTTLPGSEASNSDEKPVWLDEALDASSRGMTKPCYTVAEIARRLGFGWAEMRALNASGKLPFRARNGYPVIADVDVFEFFSPEELYDGPTDFWDETQV